MSADLLLTVEEIQELKKYKFISKNTIRDTVDKSNNAHDHFVNRLPQILLNKLRERNFSLSDTEIRASVGEGRMSEVSWIAILDEKLVPRNKRHQLTTQRGIYIVILFDRLLENAYLAIGNGAEYLNGRELMRITRNQIELVGEQSNPNYILNYNFNLYLGNSERPKNYVKGIPLYRKYPISQIYLDNLIEDIINFQEILEAIVIEKGIEEIENEIQGKSQKQDRKFTAISVDKYTKLREFQEKRNKDIGTLAERFVYEQELARVEVSNKSLIKRVVWIAQDFDGLGYDIESLFDDGSPKYIEVKGTSLNTGKITFYLSRNELEKAKLLEDKYILVLVSNVGTNKTAKIIKEIINPARNLFSSLEPIQYRGTYNNN
ncbi:DUF3578 domain-containing protein [Virgibacillus halodenitrificans]|uniref:MrcB family domain-containing protein n=1 Tax=Virgibacillus halodenitrificans TaxID=1482 RepID=UPI0013721C53|nr:DUF3578 domain-containing protein [Virgibacillus halodenitrificans]MYL44609.1 DUF3578 domain-containing protein [Virgibacillus halodenitrificans]